jgi:pimeloyl-ACP methyl ester carboxylesterase
MAPVARELSKERSVLEPLQTSDSVRGQVDELRSVLAEHGDPPVTLAGSSWGAMLGYLFAARHSELVRKLIMVGSGVYEEKYAEQITATRLSRLAGGDLKEAVELMESLDSPEVSDKDMRMARLGNLFTKADAYNPQILDTQAETEALQVQYELGQKVWSEAVDLRRSGKLLELGKRIECPVVAIHGDYDPHPAEGIREPLSRVVKDFRFVLLSHCGHDPWMEREARDEFYALLRAELGQESGALGVHCARTL